ncbi:MAG TPA: tetratricopeptide repeat protein [Burkholderiales bacterium]|nr:tetratricopeptide repeat protein [Burkholderiales bacterium]
MLKRKPLVLALVAAGLFAAEGLPDAYSEDVFVPELALLDGGTCNSATIGRSPLLLQLAQARPTEVSPAGAAAAAAAPAAAESAPPLIPGLGKHSYRISTSSPQAQRYFDQGLRLAWGFNHAEAGRAFRQAQKLDPDCAMCYWGEAYVLGPNINVPMDEKANAPAAAAAAKALALAARATPRERALIDAIAARYSADPKAARPQLDKAYAEALARAAAKFPDDLDIAALYAESLMDLSPWDYWETGGTKEKAAVAGLVATLERVLAKQPDHVGAIHLYIHAVEASADARRAERYADRLARLAPGAGHLVHMPAHIYFRVGRYKDSLATNRVAVNVDEAYIKRFRPEGVYPLAYYPHNVHFVLVSAQMAGDGRTAVEAATKLGGVVSGEVARSVLLLQPVKAAPYFAHARFSDAATVLALPDPGADFPYIQAIWRYARGIALAQSGDAGAAGAELAAIERLAATTDFKGFDAWKIPAKDVMQIAAHVLRARIAQAGKDLDGAQKQLEAAVALQDKLPYMEPPYWDYPVRQSLGAVLELEGEHQKARDVFRDSLVRIPNNGWALYGLAQTYEREGKAREAREVEKRLQRSWTGERGRLDLTRL